MVQNCQQNIMINNINTFVIPSRLRVIRDGSGDWVSHHDQEFGVGIHLMDSLWNLPCHKVTWGFLHCHLTFQSCRHVMPTTDEKHFCTTKLLGLQNPAIFVTLRIKEPITVIRM